MRGLLNIGVGAITFTSFAFWIFKKQRKRKPLLWKPVVLTTPLILFSILYNAKRKTR